MTDLEILHRRLANQQIAGPVFNNPQDLAAWMCSTQAQDYPNAKWALGLRLDGHDESGIEKAIDNRSIIRTWLNRGTLHLVAAPDIRWLLSLMGPRLIASMASRHRNLELDKNTFSKSYAVLLKELDGGRQLVRRDITEALSRAGIAASGVRLAHILQTASLESLICFGSRQGNDYSFMLLDNAVPGAKIPDREEMLAELARRYFTSRGPAMLVDFAWWSGLSAAETRTALELAKTRLVHETIDGRHYFMGENVNEPFLQAHGTYLLPAFDEYIIAYRERSACLEPGISSRVISVNGIFYPVIVIDGMVKGTWKRVIKKDKVSIEFKPFKPLTAYEEESVERAAVEFVSFVGKDRKG